ncbi:hypothetical protein C8R43DRAFT_944752 [Mycena crocata]|nr:hypothetical protein C8R43DRAFT_944752 [Mycena crocata]
MTMLGKLSFTPWHGLLTPNVEVKQLKDHTVKVPSLQSTHSRDQRAIMPPHFWPQRDMGKMDPVADPLHTPPPMTQLTASSSHRNIVKTIQMACTNCRKHKIRQKQEDHPGLSWQGFALVSPQEMCGYLGRYPHVPLSSSASAHPPQEKKDDDGNGDDSAGEDKPTPKRK